MKTPTYIGESVGPKLDLTGPMYIGERINPPLEDDEMATKLEKAKEKVELKKKKEMKRLRKAESVPNGWRNLEEITRGIVQVERKFLSNDLIKHRTLSFSKRKISLQMSARVIKRKKCKHVKDYVTYNGTFYYSERLQSYILTHYFSKKVFVVNKTMANKVDLKRDMIRDVKNIL